ncbi:uncharacterized protein TNCV_657601 [Trichonephila clavipes]|nr:uncharacterized protein TNCV_657601 [Trichonephila clavipes]
MSPPCPSRDLNPEPMGVVCLRDSLRWRAVGWMEMGLSQADVARRLVVLFSDFGINTNPKILCPEDLFQADPRATTPAEDRFSSSFGTKEKNHYCSAARCRPLSSIRKKNLRYYGAKSSSQCRSVCKKTSCVRSPPTDDSEGTAYAGQENMFLDTATMGFCAVHRRVQIYNGESDSGRLLIWREQRTRYHQSNTVERHSYRGGGILVLGRDLARWATLTCMCSMEEP